MTKFGAGILVLDDLFLDDGILFEPTSTSLELRIGSRIIVVIIITVRRRTPFIIVVVATLAIRVFLTLRLVLVVRLQEKEEEIKMVGERYLANPKQT